MGYIDKLVNFTQFNKSQMSIITALLIFYMIIANNFIADLYSGQLRDYIRSNRWMQHMIGYITMLLLIVQFGNITDGWKATLYSLVGYGWFILTTKLDIQWSLAILGLLVIGFMYEKNMFQKEKLLKSDQAVEKKQKKRIRKENNNMKKIIALSIFFITVVGTLMYFMKKKEQYGGSFDTVKFFLDDRCKKIEI